MSWIKLNRIEIKKTENLVKTYDPISISWEITWKGVETTCFSTFNHVATMTPAWGHFQINHPHPRISIIFPKRRLITDIFPQSELQVFFPCRWGGFSPRDEWWAWRPCITWGLFSRSGEILLAPPSERPTWGFLLKGNFPRVDPRERKVKVQAGNATFFPRGC